MHGSGSGPRHPNGPEQVPLHIPCTSPCADLAESRAETAAARNALEAVLLEQARHLADIGHHIRTPLTAITGYASLLARAEGLAPDVRHRARQIEAAGHILAATVTRLLDGVAPIAVPPPPGGSERLRGLRALVVDDHLHVRDILAMTLEAFGMTVTAVADGLACLECLAEQPFDVILMDYRMPGLNGRQVLDRIRADPGPNQTTRVVAVTAELSPVNAPVFAAFDGVVTKPISANALAQVISSLVAQGPPPRRAEGRASAFPRPRSWSRRDRRRRHPCRCRRWCCRP